MSVFHRSRTGRKTNDTAAIFVHAGAGYHSVQNESVHLQACNDAAVAAMALLRAGGTAVQAVEMAIKILEDREITNAGYGSNLAIDGTVEGDAIVVDHFGRSGGVGAVAQIKNPICLARTVLDLSTQELSLRRVPPNLLVGQGATDFAFEHGIPVLPQDVLVSPAARERWLRWKQDLKTAEKRVRQQGEGSGGKTPASPAPPEDPPGYEDLIRNQIRRENSRNIQAAVWNEGQPVSPVPSAARPLSGISTRSRTSSIDTPNTNNTPVTPASNNSDVSVEDAAPLTARNLANLDERRELEAATADATMSDIDDNDVVNYAYGPHDGHSMSDEDTSSDSTLILPSVSPSPTHSEVLPSAALHHSEDVDSGMQESPADSQEPADCINDTVGAVAIDNEGNIACGASSGGIGMKYRGRVGPAALVGVGAAVVPVDPEDKSRMCTAAVTSGTGEHMATTLAASVCAERLYHGVKKRRGGGFEHAEDDQAVRSMIDHDFMEHPSVKHSHSSGAIGVLAVKKTINGAYLYFAHNTDSFALASMHADDPKPTCTMSRSHGNGMVAQGGRAIRHKRKW